METHTFGYWLRLQRKSLDLTREAFAARVGCSAATIRKIEAEERRPSAQIVERIADVFSIPPDERPALLRFARGDPFAARADAESSSRQYRQPAPQHNLPAQLTRFIGRERDVLEIGAWLSASRLITLTGPGGAGKTRLAQQVAAGLLDAPAFPNGVWQVALAPLADPTLLAAATANSLGLKERPGTPIMDALVDHLRPKQLLLLLDNCEHLIQACAELAEMMLQACPRLRLLATSREALGLTGERVYPVPPLSLPEANPPHFVDGLRRSEAAQLFVERASAVLPGFALTHNNARAVAEICQQLDGMPLAIELAAARVTVLPVEQIAARLGDRFHLLTGGSRTAQHRHQTLQALIDWSYDLLSEPERILLRRLAVFMGGWTLAAAEAVGAGESVGTSDVFDLLTQLANKSLVMINHQPEAERRYWMLETIRQYALAKLEASGEMNVMRERHLAFFMVLAEPGAEAVGPAVVAWLDAMHSEHDNLRAALGWAQATVGGAEIGLRLATVLFAFWTGRGLFGEGRLWLEAAIARADREPPPDQRPWARALVRLAQLSANQGDYIAGQEKLAASLKVFRELGDRTGIAWVLGHSGFLAREQGDTATARLRLEESLAIFRELGDQMSVAYGLVTLGAVAIMQEDTAWATALLEEGLALLRPQQEREGLGWALNHLGQVAQIQGDYERAARLHAESLPTFRDLGARHSGTGWAYRGLGEIALAQGNAVLATEYLINALTLFLDLGERPSTAWCLAGLAGVAAFDQNPLRAAQLWGAAEALRQAIGCRPAPAARATRERLMAAAREQLGDEAFAAAWAEGQKLTMEQAIELALQSEAEA